MMTTAEELKNYPKSQRKCNFSQKPTLKYFKQYTQTNCEIECEVNYIVKYCKCHPLYIESKQGRNVLADIFFLSSIYS
jgi:Amiloride-sensitive sodium channel